MLSIIIPSRTDAYLDLLIDSILRIIPDNGSEIIVGDNGISQACIRSITQKVLSGPASIGIKWVRIPEPFCFAQAINRCVDQALLASDLLILNDDTEIISPDFFYQISDQLKQLHNRGFGIFSPRIEGGVGNTDQNKESKELFKTHKPVCFIAVVVRRSVWNAVGALDEAYKYYGFEDTDFCRRVVDAGWSLGVLGSIAVRHGAGTVSGMSGTFSRIFGDKQQELFHNAQAVFEGKWGKGPQLGNYESEAMDVYGVGDQAGIGSRAEMVAFDDLEDSIPLDRWELKRLAPAPPDATLHGLGTDIESDLELLWSLVYLHKPRVAIELGTRQAISTRTIGHAMKRLNHGNLVSVDPDPTCQSYLNDAWVFFVCAMGETVAERIKNDNFYGITKIDFLFIDTDPHTYDQTKMWLELYGPLLASNAIVAFHDVVPARPEIQVAEAVRDWIKDKPGWEWVEFQTPPGYYAVPQGGIGVLRALQ